MEGWNRKMEFQTQGRKNKMRDELNFDSIRELNIGTVVSTSPNEIKVLLDTNAPQNTSLNTGVPSLFPRINGFVLVPKEVGAVVGMIDWMGVERFSSKVKNSDVIDLPYPQRRMSIVPIGTLKKEFVDDKEKYVMERGVFSFPSVGDSVVIPDENQLKAIVKNEDKNAKINLGKAPLAANSDIYVDPDKLFGKHLAVLGNTGSGKSCSVAGMIRWSVEAAKEHIESEEQNLNSRFIVLDPNGEYKPAFEDLDNEVENHRVYLAGEELQDEVKSFNLPAWMWNSFEWSSLTRAQPGAQRPLLLDALRGIKSGRELEDSNLIQLRRFLNGQKVNLENYLATPPVNMEWLEHRNCGKSLENFNEDLENIYLDEGFEINDEMRESLVSLQRTSERIRNNRHYVSQSGNEGYNDFSETDLHTIHDELGTVLDDIDSIIDFRGDRNENSADSPIQFPVLDLPDYLTNLAGQQDMNLTQFTNFLAMRIRFLVEDERLRNVVNPEDEVGLIDWLNEYLSGKDQGDPSIVILDLSLIPSDVIHIIIAVFARLIFEALQRYRKENGKELPTVLALEEAHTFVNRSFSSNNDIQSYNELCLRIFERVSREGRKFGLSLILSSQRPSEISPTVLSQCNSFLLHRIVNDRDQELVRRLVPDNIGSLLNEIPTLPSQKAILVGLATSIPLLLTIRNLPESQRPKSEDPKFWDVWTGKEQRDVNWQPIVEKWQGTEREENSENEENA
ncbi:ATP-binding protein [Aliifodinibius sp. S!AR15-10]|uniref:ATP-binding protein n=1 Tax=Aliifodinibius sp. S!AR15-10 TaxID=2950437 RepID=UPI00285B6393|nr:ATP-binding protein [Aliifodinibius sp. S!AR15-10]MDR8391148.1 ATP-binding protein [Aliifodinibius sp. S!AR15-10]